MASDYGIPLWYLQTFPPNRIVESGIKYHNPHTPLLQIELVLLWKKKLCLHTKTTHPYHNTTPI